jgi:hypothetical protein
MPWIAKRPTHANERARLRLRRFFYDHSQQFAGLRIGGIVVALTLVVLALWKLAT